MEKSFLPRVVKGSIRYFVRTPDDMAEVLFAAADEWTFELDGYSKEFPGVPVNNQFDPLGEMTLDWSIIRSRSPFKVTIECPTCKQEFVSVSIKKNGLWVRQNGCPNGCNPFSL